MIGLPIIAGQVALRRERLKSAGQAFSIANGPVVNGPATSPLGPVRIKVQGTSIVQA